MVTPRKPNEDDQAYLARLAVDGTAIERLRALADSEDTWILDRIPGETDAEYAERAEMLGCDDGYSRRIKCWRLVTDE